MLSVKGRSKSMSCGTGSRSWFVRCTVRRRRLRRHRRARTALGRPDPDRQGRQLRARGGRLPSSVTSAEQIGRRSWVVPQDAAATSGRLFHQVPAPSQKLITAIRSVRKVRDEVRWRGAK
ncbi:hypothetical protein GCM10010495_68870 [Kitasatospora herbaricolor]|nr:hypothetical protein GCM10010495_68870 [Kitasatospora herbaricolor]